MSQLYFKSALLPGGWAENVLIQIGPDGTIKDVAEGARIRRAYDGDVAVPGLANLHSHAFQRAMSGLTEVAGEGEDSFWTWRDWMYRFVGQLSPDDVRVIAALAYMEMLESGFTSVGEFHYLHHQIGGAAFDNPGEMLDAIYAAAEETGLAVTGLPVLYRYADFGEKPPSEAQARFISDPDWILARVAEQRARGRSCGLAFHSLRAVSEADIKAVMLAYDSGPVHIHIAEQMKEVEACIDHTNQRPVDWLYDHTDVDDRWCLVHATHMTESETSRVAKSGAVAGICPITESNLGDGTFNGVSFLKQGGAFGIGSDSHVRIDAAEELRVFEYSQRLRDQKRTRLTAEGRSTGRTLYDGAAKGGAQALNRKTGAIAKGMKADIVALDTGHPALIGKSGDHILDSWIFGGGRDCVAQVWSGGRAVVRDGRHVARAEILGTYAKTLSRLTGNI